MPADSLTFLKKKTHFAEREKCVDRKSPKAHRVCAEDHGCQAAFQPKRIPSHPKLDDVDASKELDPVQASYNSNKIARISVYYPSFGPVHGQTN